MPERADTLMVVVSERISEWIAKGEVVDRYYNPADAFGHVDLVLTTEDRPDPDAVARLVGGATVKVWNVAAPERLFYRTLGWSPRLVDRWAGPVVELARRLEPALVRCYGANINAIAAARIRRELGVPFVVSLHTHAGENRAHAARRLPRDWRTFLIRSAMVRMEKAALAQADAVICVYRYQESWARGAGARRIEVIPNAVAADALQPKTDYRLGAPPRIIVPGRQVPGKDPAPVLAALARIPDLECVLVGDGELHDQLVAQAESLGIAARCRFVRRLPNDELVAGLRDHDAVVSINDHGGVSKVELEAALTGMPILTNPHPLEERPELLEDDCVVAGPGPDSYEDGLRTLLSDEGLRERIGTALRRRAEQVARPERAEHAVAELYRELAP